MAFKIQLRRGTAAQWTAANPILAEGELGLELDTTFFKVGDGTTAWNSLPYGALAGDIADGSITESKIATSAVTETKLVNNAVTETKIANSAVTQAKLASNLSGITICTSSTRPGSPFEGQVIYETDTDLVRSYDGVAWNLVGGSTYAVASGGTTSSITAAGTSYKLHTFNSSGTLTITTSGFVDIMAIGAGGGGHGTVNPPTTGGGGGGGEIYLEIRRYMNAGTYAIAIGAGVSQGMGGRTYMNDDAFGFGVLAAQGGGAGSYVGGGLSYGGAGGGGGSYGGSYGGGTTIFGRGISRNGGTGVSSQGSGGGGGAGGNGLNASGNTGGAGGPGADISAFLGQSAGTTIRAGGGGGGGTTLGANGTGSGAANTGGGNQGVVSGGSAGFSGIFYVRSAP